MYKSSSTDCTQQKIHSETIVKSLFEYNVSYLFRGRNVDLNSNPFCFQFIVLNEAARENR